jgi:hypothetical protein
MRNLVVHRESLLRCCRLSPAGTGHRGLIAALSSTPARHSILACSVDGILADIPLGEGTLSTWNCNHGDEADTPDRSWFFVSSMVDGGMLCVSRLGKIVTVRENHESNSLNEFCEVEGFVDCGISSAGWSPDQSILLLVTLNNSIIAMSSDLDIVNEVPYTPSSAALPTAISWSGDGQLFALYSVDSSDSIARIRVYNRSLELLGTCRGVVEGPASVLKDVQPLVSFAPNSSLIASVQKKSGNKFQVCCFYYNNSLMTHWQIDYIH